MPTAQVGGIELYNDAIDFLGKGNNFDGVVGTADLRLLLAAWGACP